VISYVNGDLFESPAQTLVNTVNTEGVMGRGIALQFRQIYPEMFRAYQELCERGEIKIGTLFVWPTPNKWVLNFPTKREWRRRSQVDYIRRGLERFREMYRTAGIYSIAFPPLGCGNGELEFAGMVQPVMEEYLHDLPIDVFIYLPRADAHPEEHHDLAAMRRWLRSEPTYLGFEEVWADLKALLATRRTFETLTGRAEFAAEWEPESDAIRVRPSGQSVKFGREEICELWGEFRRHKVITTRSVSEKRARLLSYLMPVLAGLEYVDPIVIAETFDSIVNSPMRGIQLRPASPDGEAPKPQYAMGV